MRLGFATAASARMFSEFELMVRAFGPAMAYKLANRLALLSAADNLALVPTLPPIDCRPLDSGRSGFSVSVSGAWRLAFRPLDGGSARHLAKITAIQIVDVEEAPE